MGYNTEFPAWLAQDKRDNAQRGAMLGQNILQGLRFRADQRAYQEEAPLRQAQLGTALAQQKMVETQANVTALNAGLMANAQMGQQDALQLEGDIAGRPDGWSDPETPRRVAALIQQYPGLNNTPWHQRMNQNIEVSRKYRMELEQQTRDNEDRAVREMRLKQMELDRGPRTSTAMADAMTRAQGMADRGEIAPDQVDAKAEELYAYEKKTAMERNTAFSVKTAAEAGLDGDLKQLAVLAAANGGKLPTINEGTALKFADRAAVIELTDTVLDKIDRFNATYGKDAIDAYVGQFDVPVDRALDVIRKRKSPKDLAALDILQSFEDARTGKIKATSGQAVSKAEQDRLDKSIGTTLNRNWVSMLKTFNQNERASFNAVLNKFSDRIINEDFKRVARGRGGQTAATPASPTEPTAPQAPSGPTTVNSQAEYDALPSGSKYIDSTGRVKTKR